MGYSDRDAWMHLKDDIKMTKLPRQKSLFVYFRHSNERLELSLGFRFDLQQVDSVFPSESRQESRMIRNQKDSPPLRHETKSSPRDDENLQFHDETTLKKQNKTKKQKKQPPPQKKKKKKKKS